MTAGVSFQVAPSDVRALAAGLRRIRAAIEETGRLRPDRPDDLGSALVQQGIDDAGRSWSRARAGIGQQLDLLARAGDAAAEAYVTVDGAVSRSLSSRPAPGPTPTGADPSRWPDWWPGR
jgi:hypothetical protein